MTLHEISKHIAAEATPYATQVFCQITKKREGATKAGKPYFDIEVCDGTANERFKIWEDNPAYAICQVIQDADCIELDGTFWRNSYGLNIDHLKIRWLEKTEIQALFAGTPERRTELEQDWQEITDRVEGMIDPRLKLVCQTFLKDYGERFKRAAAARDYHHARRGGLLEHTAQMMRAAHALRTVYKKLNWDLVLAGILFHDCGKLWELDYQAQGFICPVTTIGELLGHITVGIELVNKIWRSLDQNPVFTVAGTPARELVRDHLLHLIASHHGQKEFGAPVTPRTPEAWILHHIDNMDATQEMLRATYADKPQVAPGIYDYRRPLEGHAVASLEAFSG